MFRCCSRHHYVVIVGQLVTFTGPNKPVLRRHLSTVEYLKVDCLEGIIHCLFSGCSIPVACSEDDIAVGPDPDDVGPVESYHYLAVGLVHINTHECPVIILVLGRHCCGLL